MSDHCENCDARTLFKRKAELLNVKSFGTYTVGETGI